MTKVFEQRGNESGDLSRSARIVRKKSQRGPRKVPNVPRATSCWRGPVIVADDVRELSLIAGFPNGPRMDNVAAADILDGCFRNAFDYGRMDLAAPAPAELRDWFHDVEIAATNLVLQLGLDTEPLARGALTDQAGLESPAQEHLWNALARDDPPFRTLPMELERWLYGSDSFETELRQWERQRVGSNRPKLTGGELVDLTAFVAAQGALRGLPDVLGVVIAVCRKGAVQAGARSKGGGNRQDTFSTELFIGFARAHEVLFDCKPRYRDNNREPEGPAVAWVRRLLEIAKERTPIAFVGDAAPLIAC